MLQLDFSFAMQQWILETKEQKRNAIFMNTLYRYCGVYVHYMTKNIESAGHWGNWKVCKTIKNTVIARAPKSLNQMDFEVLLKAYYTALSSGSFRRQ